MILFNAIMVLGQENLLQNNFGILKTRDGAKVEFRETFSKKRINNLPVIIYFQGSGYSTLVHPLLDTIFSRLTDLGFVVYSFNKRGIHRDKVNPLIEKIDTAIYKSLGVKQYLLDAEDEVKFVLSKEPFKNNGFIGFGQSEGTLVAAYIAEKFSNQTKALFNIGAQIIAPGLIIKEQVIDNLAEKTFIQFDENKDAHINLAEASKIPDFWNELFFIKPLKDYFSSEKEFLTLQDIIKLREEHFHKMLTDDNEEWFLNLFKTGSKFIKETFDIDANEQRYLRLNCPIFIFNGENDEETLTKYVLQLQNIQNLLGKSNVKIFIEPGLGHSLDLNSSGKPFYQNLLKELKNFSLQYK